MYTVRQDLVKQKDYYALRWNDVWFRCMVEGIDDSGLKVSAYSQILTHEIWVLACFFFV